MTHRPLLCAVALIAIACARPERPAPAPLPQASTGTPDAFGAGVVAASLSGVTVHLTSPAYTAVVRVFPRERAELAYAGASQLSPGSRRIGLPVERARVWVPSLPRLTLGSSTVDETAPECVIQRAQYTMEHSRTPQGTTPPPPPLCIPRRNPRQTDALDSRGSGRWVLGAPLPLAEHYLVVIAADAPFDPTEVAELLGELDISLVSGEAAALVVPRYLLGEDARWGAWVVHQP